MTVPTIEAVLDAVPTSDGPARVNPVDLQAEPVAVASGDVRRVLAIRLAVVPPEYAVQGFLPGRTGHCEVIGQYHGEDGMDWVDKTAAETDPTTKQIIPYVLIESVGGGTPKWLTYERRTGDGRLTGLKSLGLGGHVEEFDRGGSTYATVRNAIRRELAEELGIPDDFANKIMCGAVCVGTVNDDSTTVGQVHVGLVYRARILAADIDRIAGSDEVVPVWKTAKEIGAELAHYERWSQSVAGAIVSGLIGAF